MSGIRRYRHTYVCSELPGTAPAVVMPSVRRVFWGRRSSTVAWIRGGQRSMMREVTESDVPLRTGFRLSARWHRTDAAISLTRVSKTKYWPVTAAASVLPARRSAGSSRASAPEMSRSATRQIPCVHRLSCKTQSTSTLERISSSTWFRVIPSTSASLDRMIRWVRAARESCLMSSGIT